MTKLKIIIVILAIGGLGAASHHFLHKEGASELQSANAVAGKDGGAGRLDKPVNVGLVTAIKKDFPIRLHANGVVSALNVLDVRPQLSSSVAKVHIKEGQFVHVGELLFSLDNRVDAVNLRKAQAQLDKDLVSLADYRRQLLRNKELFSKNFISQSGVDTSQAQVDAQQAVIASDQAALAAAHVALSFDQITAPIAGRTGIISVYPGSLVQPNTSAAAMVTITQITPIAVSFALPQRSLNDAIDSMKRKDSVVTVTLPDNAGTFRGHLQFVDNQIDAASGTVKLKAVFDNADMKLWPGAFVDVALSVRILKDAIVIPQNAIIVGVNDSSVYVANAEGKAVKRTVQLLYSEASEAVVTGVEAGEKIVVDGKQNVRPGNQLREIGQGDSASDAPVNTKKSTARTASASAP